MIECKDFDVSGQPVGLGIVRDFYGVVADVKPDEAFVVTCNRFTDDALRYAKGMNIKLAILHGWKLEDDEGRLTAVHVTGHIGVPYNFRMGIEFEDERRNQEAAGPAATTHEDLQSELHLLRPGAEREQLVLALDGMFRSRTSAGEDLGDDNWRLTFLLPGCSVQRGDGAPVPIRTIKLEYSIKTDVMEFEVRSPVVSLIFTAVGEGDDLFIYEQDLKRFSIDPVTGEVRPRG